MSRSRNTPVIALLAPLVAALPAGAQVARDTARVAPIVVTATKTPLQVDHVPASVTVLGGDELRARGVTQLADALRLVPGVAIVQSGSYGAQASLFVRGGETDYAKILVDGIPVNAPGGSVDVGTITLDNVERIEVVRGPSSVVWGSDAVTGAINIVTRKRPDGARRIGGNLRARGGTYGTADVEGSLQTAGGPFRLSLDGAEHASKGIYDFNNRYRNGQGGGALASRLWSGAELELTARVADVRADYPTDFTGAPVDSNDYRTERRGLAGVRLEQQAGRVTFLAVGTSSTTRSVIENPTNDAGDPQGASISDRAVTRRRAAELRAVTDVGAADLVVGGTIEGQKQDASFRFTPNGSPGFTDESPQSTRHNAAAYVQLVRDVGATTATLGVRLDHSGRSGDFGTYRVALGHRFASDTRFRASVGTAFREPAFAETDSSSFAVANPELRPERTTSWELGVEQGMASGTLVLGATWFAQRFADMIDYDANGFPGQFRNVARARANGVEAEVRAHPVRGIDVGASYTWLDTRVLRRGFDPSPDASFATGAALLRRPKHSATGSLGLAPAWGRFDFQATYVGAREDRRFLYDAPYVQPVTLKAYTKVDASAELPVGGPYSARGAALTLRVENLTGAKYESVSGYRTPGRTVLGGMRLAF